MRRNCKVLLQNVLCLASRENKSSRLTALGRPVEFEKKEEEKHANWCVWWGTHNISVQHTQLGMNIHTHQKFHTSKNQLVHSQTGDKISLQSSELRKKCSPKIRIKIKARLNLRSQSRREFPLDSNLHSSDASESKIEIPTKYAVIESAKEKTNHM